MFHSILKELHNLTKTPEEDESVKIFASPQGGSFRMNNTDGLHFDPNIKVETVVDEAGNQSIEYRLINSAENPLPAGRFFLTYELPVCGMASDPHDFFVQNDPVIVLKRYAFCSNDKQRYPVYLHPADGTLESDIPEALVNDGGQYFFEPSGVTKFKNNIATVKLTCDPPGSGVITQELTVYKVPAEIIEIEINQVYDNNSNCKFIGNRYRYRAGDGLAKRAEWQLNDETKVVYNVKDSGSIPDFEVIIHNDEYPAVVKLITETEILPGDSSKLSNQPLVCRNEIIKDLERICPDPEKVRIRVSRNEEVQSTYHVEVNPVGGSFTLINSDGNTLQTEIPLRRNSEGPCAEVNSFYFNGFELLEKGDLGEGVYSIRYSFAECDITVNSNQFEIRFPEETPGPNVNEAIEPTIIEGETPEAPVSSGDNSDVARIVNNRHTLRLEVINELESDSSLAQTKTFGLAKMFVLFSGNEQDLNNRYMQTLSLGISSLKRASGERMDQYKQIIENATMAYLDKLVIANPQGLSPQTKGVLTGAGDNLKQNDIDINKLLKNWQGEDLKKAMNASAVDEIKKILK